MVTSRLDALAGSERFDVVADYAGPVSTEATLRFLDLPAADAPWLRDRVTASNRREPGRPGVAPAGAAARQEVQAYLVDHVATAPGDVGRALVGMGIGVDAAAVQLGTILVGGIETLPKIIAGATARFAADPVQHALLRHAPELVPAAFEEVVRLEGVLQSVGRTLLTDASVGGQPMWAGQRVVLLLQSANRDEREFADPERFDVLRDPRRHVGFGQGTHFCIGIHVARTTGVALLRGLLTRYAAFDVDLARAERPPSEFQIGWTRMPVVI
jgi:cytochrome P450